MALFSCLLSLLLLFAWSPVSHQKNCTGNEIRIDPNNPGDVQGCYNNNWSRVCGHASYWDCIRANLACHQLGYNRADTGALRRNTYNSVYGVRYICSGSETSLSECGSRRTYCGSVARAVCSEPFSQTTQGQQNCNNGEVRLVGGEEPDRGRLEICYQGQWTSFNSIDYNGAAIACRQLGYLDLPRITTDGRYGSSSNNRVVNVRCSNRNNESRLIDCALSSFPSSCFNNLRNIGLQCYMEDSSSCESGSVRLVGNFEQRGRVEVCVSGVWASVCSSTWEENLNANGYAFCSQLGHRTDTQFISPTFNLSNFGFGDGPVYRGLSCQGWESQISQCYNNIEQYRPLTNSPCNWNNVAGIECRDKCNIGDVRLVGGPNDNSGIVEVCYNNFWGYIGQPGWDNDDATTVCRQLERSTEGAVAVNVTRAGYTRARKVIHWGNVHCIGEERLISNCGAFNFPLDTAIELMMKLEVAGVSCGNGPTVRAIQDATTAGATRAVQANITTAVFTCAIFVVLIALLVAGVWFIYKPRIKKEINPDDKIEKNPTYDKIDSQVAYHKAT